VAYRCCQQDQPGHQQRREDQREPLRPPRQPVEHAMVAAHRGCRGRGFDPPAAQPQERRDQGEGGRDGHRDHADGAPTDEELISLLDDQLGSF
jgi:hypothetical protein